MSFDDLIKENIQKHTHQTKKQEKHNIKKKVTFLEEQ